LRAAAIPLDQMHLLLHSVSVEVSELPSGREKRHAKLGFQMWRLALLGWSLLTVWPVAYNTTRLLQLLLLLLLWFGAAWIWWRKRFVRWCLLIAAFAIGACFLLPGRDFSATRLRSRYVEELRCFEGVHYVWGGENCLGIDCSGLIRRALFHALWKEGIRNLNPELLRRALLLWWEDASASALASGYLDQTLVIQSVENLEGPEDFVPGDFAITSDGIHALAYVGDRKWIEADPDLRRVIFLPTANTNDLSNVWLKVPVTLVRWQVFTGS
jgi:hypothetical protein